jgi:hypothetical protein
MNTYGSIPRSLKERNPASMVRVDVDGRGMQQSTDQHRVPYTHPMNITAVTNFPLQLP